jgi:probable DNA repair protein
MPEFAPCRLSELGGSMVLCATHRLARHLRARHDEAQRAEGHARWTPLSALTVDAWLAHLTDAALLDGSLSAHEVPRLALAPVQEQALWEQAIGTATGESDADALFDREGLAALAVDANDLAETWGLAVVMDSGEEIGGETASFLRWRAEVRARCDTGRWLEPARLRAWRIGRIATGAGRLPERVAFAGFDRYTPQEKELARVLAARGVTVLQLELGRDADAAASVASLPDRPAECRAAAAWAAQRLAAKPDARLGIVVPELASQRDALAAALDDALHPQSLAPANSEMTRCYNFSLGAPLARWPLVDVALRLLRFATQPRRIAQAELAKLLLSPYWSAGDAALDARARLEVRVRELLAPTVALSDVLRLARRLRERGLALTVAIAHLEVVQAVSAQSGKERPSAWSGILARLLDESGWPGERTLSSYEWQAAGAFRETLAGLAALDAVLGKIGFAEAVRQTVRLCRERVFQPQTEGRPAVQVLGPLEAAGAEFDAVWVLGMNDDVWPPSPRPNPLLPAVLQRRAGSPNAGAEVQLNYARAIHGRLLRCAPEVVFSWAMREGDRPLRKSPLLAGIPALVLGTSLVETQTGSKQVESIDDSRAPPLAEGEKLGGGVGLLKAQAICPAWAFYRYRLGARALPAPTEGLNAADRGTLLHRVMERFWRGRDSAGLVEMSEDKRQLAVAEAVVGAISAFNDGRELPLSSRFTALERERLIRLLSAWLALELARPVPFSVFACEQSVEADIEGLKVDVRVDRVDVLADGRQVILDYKTGRNLKPTDWQGERIVEPQLPAYAVWAGVEAPAAIAFAKIRDDGCAFVGVGAEAGLLPGLKAADDWTATLAAWRAAIGAVAREIREGDASVRFADEKLLRYCEVLPLLRLPEYRAQMEKA